MSGNNSLDDFSLAAIGEQHITVEDCKTSTEATKMLIDRWREDPDHNKRVEELSEMYTGHALALKTLRTALGITQEELAERLNITQTQVSATERRSEPKISTLRQYAAATGGELEIAVRYGDRLYKVDA